MYWASKPIISNAGWFVGHYLLLRDFGLYMILFMNVCSCNRCHDMVII
jgi:hypothetical protein